MKCMVTPLPPASATSGSQTLSRGLRALELLADAEGPMSISALAEGLGVHRSNAYRVLRTLEDHRFVLRDDAGQIRLGPKLAALARTVAPGLQSTAIPVLTQLADMLGMTAFITVLDAGEVITLVSVEPSHNHPAVAQRPGARHSLTLGAPGHIIEASLSTAERASLLGDDAPISTAVRDALSRGYAISHDEVIPGLSSLAVPLRLAGEPPAAVAVVHIGQVGDVDWIAAQLQDAAERITRHYR